MVVDKVMSKITTLLGATKFSKEMRKKGQTVGLVVGSFDILHLGHANLFRFARKHADNLIVGLDNDQTIKLVKGDNRPINNYKNRARLLAELSSVDVIFPIKKISHHDSEEASEAYEWLVTTIRPTHIFTHKVCDGHWQRKGRIAKKYGMKFILDKSTKVTNSGTIINKLGL